MKIRSAMYVDVVVNLLLAVIAFAAMSRLNAATRWEYIGPILVIAALSSAIHRLWAAVKIDRPFVQCLRLISLPAQGQSFWVCQILSVVKMADDSAFCGCFIGSNNGHQ